MVYFCYLKKTFPVYLEFKVDPDNLWYNCLDFESVLLFLVVVSNLKLCGCGLNSRPTRSKNYKIP